jgi:hypothetical protein
MERPNRHESFRRECLVLGNAIAALLVATISVSASECRAADPPKEALPCSAASLDFYVMPPFASSSGPNTHMLVFEVRNIGTAACEVDSPKVQLIPKMSSQDEKDSEGISKQGEPQSAVFDRTRLNPGDWVHAFLGWISDARPHYQCLEHSGLEFYLQHEQRGTTPLVPNIIELHNLRIRSCPGFFVFLSDYRAGQYTQASGESDPWLLWMKSKFGFPVPTAVRQSVQSSPELQPVKSESRVLLGGEVPILLRLPDTADDGCNFREVRKRESDGTTAFSFQDCSEIPSAGEPKQSPPGLIPTRIDLGAIDLLAKHTGAVSYDVITNLGSPRSPSLAKASFDFVVHDPKPPAQAAIINPLPECQSAQLQIVSPPPIISESSRFMRVYEATNTSSSACSLAGVPTLNLSGNLGSPCPNCTNDLFRIRPNGRIDLEPVQSAHFLLATAAHAASWTGQNCFSVPSITLVLDRNNKWLELPFDACGKGSLDVSAWREGRFDGDPLNVQWAKVNSADADPTISIPPDCEKPELLTNGHPVILQSGGSLSLGLSIMQHEFNAGDAIKLHVWVDNTGDAPAGVMTCMTLDRFKAQGFDIFDAYGHRVLSNHEAKQQEMCRTDPRLAGRGLGWMCTRNFPIMIPAHTCVTRDDYDFMTILDRDYELPPGAYTLRLRTDWEKANDVCEPQKKETLSRQPGDITFTVNQP